MPTILINTNLNKTKKSSSSSASTVVVGATATTTITSDEGQQKGDATGVGSSSVASSSSSTTTNACQQESLDAEFRHDLNTIITKLLNKSDSVKTQTKLIIIMIIFAKAW